MVFQVRLIFRFSIFCVVLFFGLGSKVVLGIVEVSHKSIWLIENGHEVRKSDSKKNVLVG